MTEGGSNRPDDGLIEGILAAGPQPASPGQRSELLTFLFADIRGYTRFTQQHGDEAAGKLTAKFATVVRHVVAEYDGTVFELRGDEAMCVFASPRQSLRAAVALQRRFVDETLADERLPMTVGIGVDAGEAVRSEDGYRGGALNLAARLCSKAQAGEVLATNEVTHLARRIDGIQYLVQEGVVLKGIADPVRPVRVLPEGEDPTQQLAALLPAPPSAEPAPWMPGPLGRRSRRTVAGLAVVALLAVGGIIVGFTVGRTAGSSTLAENSVGVIDLGSTRVIADVTVPADPAAAAAGFGAVWTANAGANNVSRIDAVSRQVTNVGVGSSPSALAAGLGGVWVANSASGTVTRLDPSGNTTSTVAVGTRPGGVAIAAGSVWVTNTGDGTVSRIDPATNRVVQTVPVGDGPTGIAGTSTSVWVADSASNTVSRIPVSHGRAIPSAVQPIAVGNDPTGVAIDGTNVWVTNNLDGTVDRIAGDSVSGIDVGGEPTQITVSDGRLWVLDQAGMSASEIDPAGHVTRKLLLGVIPGGLAVLDQHIWIGATVNPLLHRGGTLRVIGPDPFPLDPDYLQSPWTIAVSSIVYDGLVRYRPAAGAAASAVVPDLATAIPQPRDNGKTYVFTLRPGVRWSTGKLLTVDDIRRGLERSIAAPLNPFKGEIAGADGCTAKHCSISGITVQRAARIITIRLIQPNEAFLSQLASYAAAVPAATPLAPARRPIPGTGPYQFGAIQPGKQVTLIRNQFFHQWSAAAQPAGLPDQISYQVSGIAPGGADGRHSVAAVRQGRFDITDARGTQAYPSLQAAFGDRVFLTPTLTTHGLALNTRIAPFSNPLARQAVAFAINRSVVASKWFTDATVTCQVLPPDFPAHRPYCPYTSTVNPNGQWDGSAVVRAQRMVGRSGTKGAHIVLYTPPNQAAAMRQVVTAMRQIGYHPRLKIYDGKEEYFTYIGDSRHRVQAAFFGWVADDFSASDFFVGLFDCKSFKPASSLNNNPAEFCDPSIDQLMNRAVRVQSTSLAKADPLWAKVDRRVTDAAPFVPLVTPTWVDVVSKRVHNYQRSPVIGVLYDQMWVH